MKGFREDFDSYDLEAGCMHGNHIEDHVKFLSYGEADSLEVLETLGLDLSSLTKKTFGFGSGLTEKELIKELKKVNTGEYPFWDIILENFSKNQLCPVIMINNELCDGAHRCILMYALGLKIPVAYFKTSY